MVLSGSTSGKSSADSVKSSAELLINYYDISLIANTALGPALA